MNWVQWSLNLMMSLREMDKSGTITVIVGYAFCEVDHHWEIDAMESGSLELMDIEVGQNSEPVWLVDCVREPDDSYREFGWARASFTGRRS